MNTRLYEFVIAHLRSTSLTRAEIAAGSGVPLSTLNKIATANIENPGIRHIEALAEYFIARDAVHEVPKIKPQPEEAAA